MTVKVTSQEGVLFELLPNDHITENIRFVMAAESASAIPYLEQTYVFCFSLKLTKCKPRP